MAELLVLANGNLMGRVTQRYGGELEFTYEQSWQDHRRSYPISLCMPLTRRVHPDSAVRPFMDGLLPDNSGVLEQWARRFQVSVRNPFALLTHMGEDCAGAIQFVPHERYEERWDSEDQIEWLTEADVAERLHELVEQYGTGRRAGDVGQFSLAGAQPKLSLLYDGERWGIPSGLVPTTHIFKPPTRNGFDGLHINEHICLMLAQELGLKVARSTIQTFDGTQTLVVDRYDRAQLEDGRWIRLHQEDVCQALAMPPQRKYQNEGGPGPKEVVALLLDESNDPDSDVGAFIDALALNWVIRGTDGHAKNYSILLAPDSIRLAPLYDLISILPYPLMVSDREAKLAMKIGSEYPIWKIRCRHWERLAADCDLDARPLVDRVTELVASIPAAIDRATASVREDGNDPPIVDTLSTAVREQVDRCLQVLESD